MSFLRDALRPLGTRALGSAQGGPVFGTSHREAQRALTVAIRNGERFLSLTGEAGIGKTTTLEAVMTELAGGGIRFARIGAGPSGPLTVGRVVVQILNDERSEGASEDDLQRVVHVLTERLGRENQIVVAIEGAERLERAALELLQLVPSLHRDGSPLLQVLFVGRPTFWLLLDELSLAPLKDRITTRAVVGPLTDKEAARYVEYQLLMAGHSAATRLGGGAMQRVLRTAGGNPARINILLDQLLATDRDARGAARTRPPRPVADGALHGRQPERLAPALSSGAARSVPAGRRRRAWLARSVAGFAVMGVIVLAGYATFYRAFPPGTRPLSPESSAHPALATAPPPSPAPEAAHGADARPPAEQPPTSDPPAASAAPRPLLDVRPPARPPAAPTRTAEPPQAAERNGPDKLKQDFDAFLSGVGGQASRLSGAQRQALFEQYLAHHDAAGAPDGGASLSGHRIVIHFPEAAPTGQQQALQLAGILRPVAGESEIRAVRSGPGYPSVRYFFREDAEAAASLAATLEDGGTRWRVRNFTTFARKPSRGTLEVWLPSQ